MITQLYGRCREAGMCICGGVNGCTDDLAITEGVEQKQTRELIEKENAPKTRPDLVEAGNDEVFECGYCRRKGSPCSRHGGEPTKYVPKPKPEPYVDPISEPLAPNPEPIINREPARITIEFGKLKITIEGVDHADL